MCHCFLTVSQPTTAWKQVWQFFFQTWKFSPQKTLRLRRSQDTSASWWAPLSVSCCCKLLIIAWGAAGGVMQQVHSGGFLPLPMFPTHAQTEIKMFDNNTNTAVCLRRRSARVLSGAEAPPDPTPAGKRRSLCVSVCVRASLEAEVTMMSCHLPLTPDQWFESRPSEKQNRQVGMLLSNTKSLFARTDFYSFNLCFF